MENLTYEQIIELEENIKLKNEAEKIYKNFLRNVKLEAKNYKGDGRFLFWSDQHNATYFVIRIDHEAAKQVFYFECKFLHESYIVLVKDKYRGVDHLISAVREQ